MKTLLFYLLISVYFCAVHADPLVFKGADDTIIAAVAISWYEKDGGVFLSIDERADLDKLKKSVSELFPDMNIELFGRKLFFSSITQDALFAIISGVDTGVAVKRDPFAVLKQPEFAEKTLFVEQTAQVQTKSIEELEALVEKVETRAGERLFVKLTVVIAKSARKGKFRFVRGRRYVKIFFDSDQQGNASLSAENRKKAQLLMVKKGQRIIFMPEKRERDGSYLVSSFRIIQ